MKQAHRITITVHIKPEEDEEALKAGLLSLIPFSTEEEKLGLKRAIVQGFSERRIIIYSAELEKERHIKAFLEMLKSRLGEEQKDLLVSQKNRVDDECCFYMRLDKQRLLGGEIWLTDSGDCYHIKMCIAAFPKKRECALEVVRKLFGPA